MGSHKKYHWVLGRKPVQNLSCYGVMSNEWRNGKRLRSPIFGCCYALSKIGITTRLLLAKWTHIFISLYKTRDWVKVSKIMLNSSIWLSLFFLNCHERIKKYFHNICKITINIRRQPTGRWEDKRQTVCISNVSNYFQNYEFNNLQLLSRHITFDNLGMYVRIKNRVYEYVWLRLIV